MQFLVTVGTDVSLLNCPKNKPSVEEILKYTLREEIKNTAKIGCYSGNDTMW